MPATHDAKAIPPGKETPANLANISSAQYGTPVFEAGRLEVWALASTANNPSNTPKLLASIPLRDAWYEYYHYWYFTFVKSRLAYGMTSPPIPFKDYKAQLQQAMTIAQKPGGVSKLGKLQAAGAALTLEEEGVPEYGPPHPAQRHGHLDDVDMTTLSAKASPCESTNKFDGESASKLTTSMAQAAKQMGMRACSHRSIQGLFGAAGASESVGCEAWALTASSYNTFNDTVACSMSSTSGSMSSMVKQSIKINISMDHVTAGSVVVGVIRR